MGMGRRRVRALRFREVSLSLARGECRRFRCGRYRVVAGAAGDGLQLGRKGRKWVGSIKNTQRFESASEKARVYHLLQPHTRARVFNKGKQGDC
jgi:hypothetical protein